VGAGIASDRRVCPVPDRYIHAGARTFDKDDPGVADCAGDPDRRTPMDESAKYLIHADVTASGVVEREDVVGAVYGQTEGLLGDELDLRYLQESSKAGRIDVDVDSEGGRSFGELTIATSMDRVETAVLAASLETIGRVGPCRSEFRITGIEDVRAAKRREVVERAKELLSESFEGPATTSEEILEEVRRAVRVEDITEYEGLPAGPNVADTDAVIVVEGRSDVLQLLEYGVKNAIAVEGTDVPDAVAELTHDRTVTAFLDGDRGGDLILEELSQVGDVDHVALAPPDRSVEDMERHEVMSALRQKVPYERIDEEGTGVAGVPTDGGTVGERTPNAEQPAVPQGPGETAREASPREQSPGEDVAQPADEAVAKTGDAVDGEPADEETAGGEAVDGEPADDEPAEDTEPTTFGGHVDAVEGTGTARLLDADFGTLATDDAGAAFEAVESVEDVPAAVLLDGTLSQRVLDVCAQRGVDQVVAAEVGDLVKQPVGVRVRTLDQLQ
jgi:DNA primase